MMQQAMSQMGGLGGMGGMGGMGGLGGLGGFGGMGGLGGFGNAGNTGVSAPTSASTNFKELYKTQLEQLAEMGYTNETVNIDILKATGGNVDAAVDRLLNMLG
jgi:ubiquilin